MLTVLIRIIGLFRNVASALKYISFSLQLCHHEFKGIVSNAEIGSAGHTAVNGCMETKEYKAGPFSFSVRVSLTQIGEFQNLGKEPLIGRDPQRG